MELVQHAPGSGQMRKVGITIAIPTYNRAAELQRTLLGLRELRTGPDETFEIIVIGNNCTDNTSAMVARNVPTFGGRLRYVEEQRQGLNHARNRAIADAQYDVVAFLDDDVDIDPAWIMGRRPARSRPFNFLLTASLSDKTRPSRTRQRGVQVPRGRIQSSCARPTTSAT